MKDFIEDLCEKNGAARMEVTEIFKHLPNFRLVAGRKMTDKFLSRGLTDFHAALNYVWKLPYGRNSDRADFNLVLKEGRGTCSTKHAALAQLAAEQNQPIFLTMGIYEMNAANTAGIGEVLDEFGLKSLPEAHCYLTYTERRFDVTRFSNEKTKPIENFLYEERISPHQIGDYKVALHRKFFQDWMCGKNLDEKFSFEDLWNVREKCIAALAQTS
jgi:hypothetical protein